MIAAAEESVFVSVYVEPRFDKYPAGVKSALRNTGTNGKL